MELEINPIRLNYLLDLYSMSKDSLVVRISGKRKKLLTSDLDVMLKKRKIPLSLLKKIDAIFGKGLNWYATDRKLPETNSSSIFFRKEKFNSELNFESKKITNRFEEKKFEIQTLCSAINFNVERKLEQYSSDSDVRTIAKMVREQFDKIELELVEKRAIKKSKSDLDQLKKYIAIIERMNIFVFEYLEHPKKIEKTIFNGFYMHPNIIVIKGQKYRRREIFTLIHEFAHYLLNLEEIDEVEETKLHEQQNKIEKWCNDFVYYFLIGNYEKTVDQMDVATNKNNFHQEKINEVYSNTSLSASALYTHLRIKNKISQIDYDKKIQSINDAITRENLEEKIKRAEERALLEEQGKEIRFFSKKQLQSQLFKEIVKINYFEGNLDESQLCNYLSIKSDKIEREIY